MFNNLYDNLATTSPVAIVIIAIALMLFLGFAMTRLTKLLKLPNVTAYITVGILIGPYCLNLIPSQVIYGMSFLTDIALAFIAFSVGEFFRLSVLKKNGLKVVVISLLDACVASVLVFLLMYFVLRLSLAFSIVLAALASATAPASTVMTIRQTGAHGDFVETLLQVVAIDDVLSLIAYSIAISVALVSTSGNADVLSFGIIALPILINIGIVILGCGFGYFLRLFMTKKRTTDNRLIISIALLFAFCGICAILGVSPLLGCMSMGMVYVNIAEDDTLFKQLNYFSPPILLLFFVTSGLNFNLNSLFSTSSAVGATSLLIVGIVYFAIRIVGKYAGAFWGCAVTKKSKEIRNLLGLALIPQAGVAIGLAALGARTLGPGIGGDLQTIVLASSVLCEIVGPACAKLALYLSNSYSTRLEDIVQVKEIKENGQLKTPVELLIERIKKIQTELPARVSKFSEEEKAFTQAAEEYYDSASHLRSRRFINKR
jgi:Kef-type K+ transport system membrane component KefB